MFYDKLLTISEAAKILGISTSTLRRLEKENGVVEGYGLKVIYTPGGQRRYLLDEIQQLYTSQGFSGKVGFGIKPALLVRDFTTAFFEPHSLFSISVNDQVSSTIELIEAAKESNIPVIFSKTVYKPEEEISKLWGSKFPSLEILKVESPWVIPLPEISKYNFDMINETPYITDFHNSSLNSFLKDREIDTIVLAGVTTSGSVRANAVEGLQQGYKMIVAKEAVGDRNKSIHTSALIDLNARYADVKNVKDILTYYKSINTKQY
ncbi:isochorismatase family protein [Sporosarcina aquimarina]|uniref:isochorismatase family protein n=1 Tax=Sporosarcina aquimarina TaxID=114975 RepID=UPI001C8D558F|nr:isochorismatase family protein [Sporosarcina aquimarina]MBY0221393.1 isochorismatase family protein [Sporosarcina aquimarina]